MQPFRATVAFSSTVLLLTACSQFDATPNALLTVGREGPVTTSSVAYAETQNNVAPKTNNLINLFSHTYQESIGKPSDQTKATNFYKAGVQLVRTNCQDFFTEIGKVRQSLDFGEAALATGGSAAIGILGITGASATTLALIGAGIATTLGFTENYSNVYLFNPDTEAVQKLVVKAQNTYLAEVEKAPPSDFYSAFAYLQGLQNVCEVHSIKKLVNEAIAKGEVTADSDTADTLGDLEGIGIIRLIERQIGKTPLIEAELAALYWYLIDGTYDEKGAEQIKETLANLGAKGPWSSSGEPNAAFDPISGSVKTMLLQLPRSYRNRYEAIIQGWRTTLANTAEPEPSGAITESQEPLPPGGGTTPTGTVTVPTLSIE